MVYTVVFEHLMYGEWFKKFEKFDIYQDALNRKAQLLELGSVIKNVHINIHEVKE